jgi:thioredoxin-like negative regulator of GroEL
MRLVQVHTYRQLLTGVRLEKHAVVTFTSPSCPASNNMKARLAERRDVQITVFDVDYYKNKPIAKLFDIRYLPSAVLLEHGMPIDRMTGMFEFEQFFETINDLVMLGKNPFE